MSEDLELQFWTGWYDDPNPLRVAATGFSKLIPALLIAGGVCISGVLVASFATNPIQVVETTRELVRLIVWIALFVLCGSICTAAVGFCVSLLLALFDYSMGKILSPILFSAATTGASVIPIEIIAISQRGLSTHPETEIFAYVYYILTIMAGSTCGIWFAGSRISGDTHGFFNDLQFASRQLFALTFWVALVFSLGIADAVFFIALLIYIVTVAFIMLLYVRVCRRIEVRAPIGE